MERLAVDEDEEAIIEEGAGFPGVGSAVVEGSVVRHDLDLLEANGDADPFKGAIEGL